MFKSLSLIISKRKALKNNKFKRKSLGFDKIQKVGVILNDKNLDSSEVDKFIQRFKEEGISVEVLCYKTKKSSSPKLKSKFISFQKKDIKWTGKLLNFKLKKFIRTDFDYLFSIVDNSSLALDAVLAHSNAKCRVGRFEDNRSDLYELMVCNESNSIKDLSQQMLHYTSKIK